MFRRNARFRNSILSACIAITAVLMLTSCGTIAALSQVSSVKATEDWKTPQVLPDPINSSEWEDSPSISPDGKTLYFTRGTERNVDIYVSIKTSEGWSEPKMLSQLHAATFPTGGPHTQDNKTLYFSSFRPGGHGESDIYESKKTADGWNQPKNLGDTINSSKMDAEPYISRDGKILLFSTNRDGSSDIYMAKKKKNGTWGKPSSLRSPINTSGDETQPFLSDDGKSLYFMAVNRNNIPGPAIFCSQKMDGKWTEPYLVISGLVGEPTLTSDGKYLYFVHIIMEGTRLTDGEIMFTERK